MEKKVLIPEKQVVSRKKCIDDFNGLNYQQFDEIRHQIDQAIKMGVSPEQPVQLPTIVVIGLIRMIDQLKVVSDANVKEENLPDINALLSDIAKEETKNNE